MIGGAAGLTILSGGAMRGLMDAPMPLFERESGATLAIEFGLTSILKDAIAAGAVFDVALLPRPELDALAQEGGIAVGTAREAAKPDIGRSTHSNGHCGRRAITYSDGPSGAYIADLLKRLGMAAEMTPKTRLTTGPVAELVAKGDAEIGLQQIVAILPVKGAELVGPLPNELQNIIIYAAGLAPRARDDATARRFIAFMATPEVARIVREEGMEPA